LRWTKIEIQTYKELKETLKVLDNSKTNLLIIKSLGGLGKTHLTEELFKYALFIKGYITPLELYIKLFENNDKLVIFDDVDSLLKEKKNISLLKQLCENEKDKKISYSSTTMTTRYEIEQDFISNNRVIILCNDLNAKGFDINALVTRGFYIHFNPSNEEVLRELETFKDIDKEITTSLKENIRKIRHFNFRIYNRCLNYKTGGGDYLNYLRIEYKLNQDYSFIRRLKEMPIKDRNALWQKTTGKSIRQLQRNLKAINQNDIKDVVL
jgi:hypothetical protein